MMEQDKDKQAAQEQHDLELGKQLREKTLERQELAKKSLEITKNVITQCLDLPCDKFAEAILQINKDFLPVLFELKRLQYLEGINMQLIYLNDHFAKEGKKL